MGMMMLVKLIKNAVHFKMILFSIFKYSKFLDISDANDPKVVSSLTGYQSRA